ncbi:MAG: ribosome biogenesis/translation initiation ATPase RLI [Candidatus Aenigmarchaeota archaeon]|nr:ribosome biogenesis/translation initiation ATPase RLI [Candidatus Aenigmarchaeota archaeon]
MTKRIAVIDREACKPSVCNHLCKRMCPINRSGDDCITVNEADKKPLIDEDLCVGCGICSNKCPTLAISIINLPRELHETPVHRYGRNQFVLFRLPVPRRRLVVGLIGQNGVGKSTALKILSGELKPNTGMLGKSIPWDQIIGMFKGSELQDYLTKLKERGVKVAYKPQNIDSIPRMWKGKAGELLSKVDERGRLSSVREGLNLAPLLDKDLRSMSGGELQLLAVAATLLKDAGLYFFDEPSSFLDVEQRLIVAREIRKLSQDSMVMVVEHDLAVADYLADQVHILYGKPACFGIISKPQGVRTGINTYLEGYVKEENVRFRDESIVFSKGAAESLKTQAFLRFPAYKKSFGPFSMATEGSTLCKGEIIGILGPNATGKTTFINMLTGKVKPNQGVGIKDLRLAYKPQRIELGDEQSEMTVREYLAGEIDPGSKRSKRIVRVLELEKLFERKMGNLSGGEAQAVLIAANLGKDFDILLLDEPTAFLDVEQRLRVAKLIREVVEGMEVAAFIVDHDLQIIDAVADRVMVFEGERGKKGFGHAPTNLRDGMNSFLKKLNITFRRDPHTGRARANKPDSVLDREQKEKGDYYYS